ncbi:MAG: hypothetical protein AB7P21_28240 [Lautropia sp.]
MADPRSRRTFIGGTLSLLGACSDPLGLRSDSSTTVSGEGTGSPDGTADPVGVTPGAAPAPSFVPGVTWPVLETVTRYPGSSAEFNPLQVPAYLAQVSEPRAPKQLASGRGKATVLTRISDVKAFAPPTQGGWTNFGPVYASRQHWNADHSRMIVHAYDIATTGAVNPHYLTTAAHFLDGRTGAYLKPCSTPQRGLPPHWRWSNTDPDELLFVEYKGTTLGKYSLKADTFSVVKNFFPAYEAVTLDFNGGNAEPDLAGRYWALGMQRQGAWYIVCWDRQEDRVLSEIPVPMEPGSGHIADATMSRSGRFIVIASTLPWTAAGVSIGRGIAVFDRSGKYLRSLDQGSSATNIIDHNGVALDSDGNDVWVYFRSVTGGDDRSIVSIRLDGTSPGTGRTEVEPGLILGAFYFIACAFNRPDWVVVSDYPAPAGNTAFNQYPYRGMIWAFRLDGSGKVYSIGPSRYSTVDFKGLDWYFMIPWATPNRDLSTVLFKSSMSLDWSQGDHDTFHAYLARPAP